VLGGGAVVAELHLPALVTLGWLDDVWVADPSAAALARLSSAFPGLKVLQLDFTSALARTNDLGIRAVIVALPNALHERAVALALDAGLDVLCEKPLALSEDACVRLADQADRTGRVLGVGMTRRFLPSVAAIRRVLNAGWVGDIQSIEASDGHAFEWSTESGIYGRTDNAGVVANMGVHVIDLVEHLCGPLTPLAYSDDWRGGVEVNATMEVQTSSGAPGRFRFSYTHALEHRLTITGTGGSVWLTADPSCAQYRSTDGLEARVSANRPFRFGDWPPALASAMCEELADFRNAIHSGRPPVATAREAARTAALIDWAQSHHAMDTSAAPVVEVSAVPPPLQGGPIVVTGGTGFVGGHLLDALARRGHHELIVPIRGYQRSANAWRFPTRLERTSLLDQPRLRALMEGARYVFHLAFGRDGADARHVTVEGTRNVVEAAIDAGVECVVVVSTTAVFGDPGGGRLVDEGFPYGDRANPYEAAKAEAERWTLDRARQEKRTRLVVIDPACIYGPGGGTFTLLPARLLEGNSFCWVEDGRGIVNYVYVTNLVEALLRAATQPSAHGERFIVSDGSTSWRDFFTELLGEEACAPLPSYTRAELDALAGQAAPTLRDLARTVIGNAEVRRIIGEHPYLARLKRITERVAPATYQRAQNTRTHGDRRESATHLGHTPPPPPYLADLYGVTTSRLSAMKAQRVLGWNPSVDLKAGQAAARRWLKDLGLLQARHELHTPQPPAGSHRSPEQS